VADVAVFPEPQTEVVAGTDASPQNACDSQAQSREVGVPAPRPPQAGARVTPNLFGIGFGIAGLAGAWSAAYHLAHVPAWPAEVFWCVAAVTWLATLVPYVVNALRAHRVRADLEDSTFGPFVALAPIVAILLSVSLAEHARAVGVGVFATALVCTVLIAAWLMGQWILSETVPGQWHPGYFIPSVAGGFLASNGAAALGYPLLAKLMFGYALINYAVLAPIVFSRLFTQRQLPTPLLPTMVIAGAPPLVAANTWFEINHGRPDTVASLLTGYAIFMLLVQLRLVPAYIRVPFGPAWWAFSFSYAAAFVLAIRWLAAERAPDQQSWTYVVLTGVTLFIGALAVRTIAALLRGDFLPGPAN
jgi:tellurite resistance protein